MVKVRIDEFLLEKLRRLLADKVAEYDESWSDERAITYCMFVTFDKLDDPTWNTIKKALDSRR